MNGEQQANLNDIWVRTLNREFDNAGPVRPSIVQNDEHGQEMLLIRSGLYHGRCFEREVRGPLPSRSDRSTRVVVKRSRSAVRRCVNQR